MINFDRIETEIFLGSAPQNSVDAARLAQMKVSAVLSLQSDADLRSHRIDSEKLQKTYQHNNITVQRFPIIDFDEVDLGNRLAEPIQALNSLLSVGHRVYVHCNAGICRATSTVLGYLHLEQGMTMQQGLEYIRSKRPIANPYVSAVVQAFEEID